MHSQLLSLLLLFNLNSLSLGEERIAEEISIELQSGWGIRFFPEGDGRVQYGALPQHGAQLSAGTVDFPALIKAIQRLKINSKKKKPNHICAAIGYKGEDYSPGFHLRDDTLIRYLVDSFGNRYVAGNFGNDLQPRLKNKVFFDLLKDHPYFPDGT